MASLLRASVFCARDSRKLVNLAPQAGAMPAALCSVKILKTSGPHAKYAFAILLFTSIVYASDAKYF